MGLKSLGSSMSDLEVVGWDISDHNLQVAKKRFAIDRSVAFEECAGADVVFVCVPPADVIPVSEGIVRHCQAETVITDCSSVKSQIAKWSLDKPFFVPGHPMAGHEKGGPEFASSWMFRGAKWILCPTRLTNPVALQKVSDLVGKLEASVVLIDSAEHDRAVGFKSHLPHLLAGLLVESGHQYPNVGAGSWSDLTRVAGVDPQLWSQILTANHEELSAIVGDFAQRLLELKDHLENGNQEAIRQFLVDVAKLKEPGRKTAMQSSAVGKDERSSRQTQKKRTGRTSKGL